MNRSEHMAQDNRVVKAVRIIVITLLVVISLLMMLWFLIAAFWNGAFNFLFPKEIATYHSPDGEYSLVFEQMGDPAWPFGPTDVRLTLKNNKGKTVKRVSTQIYDDGACANERHISSISWNDDAVVVILRGSEMKNKEVSMAYSKN